MSLPTVFKHVIVSVWNSKQKQLFNNFHLPIAIVNVHEAVNKVVEQNACRPGLKFNVQVKRTSFIAENQNFRN